LRDCPASVFELGNLPGGKLERATAGTYVWSVLMHLTIELEEEDDGRWIAEIPELPGVQVYGPTQAAAAQRVRALALRVLADRVESGEADIESVTFSASGA
jgi:predicted RNase H-like HicB family nuclease